MKVMLRLYTYFRPYKGQLTLATICVFFAGGFGMAWPVMVNFAIKFGLNPKENAAGDVVSLDGTPRCCCSRVWQCCCSPLAEAWRRSGSSI
jgi:ABC-type multidrug transport system fused ATPase/permease subunit